MSISGTMLDIARHAILDRARLDGYSRQTYDPAEDVEGYIVSILNALHHWCHAHGHDWTTELSRAQSLFEDDLEELLREQSSSASQ